MKALFLLLSLLCCSVWAQEVTPTQRLNQSVEFSDDLDFENLNLAIERQITSYDRIGTRGTIKFGTKVYQKSDLRESLLLLKSLANTYVECKKASTEEICSAKFNADMNEKFAIYVPVVSKKRAQTKFTSYYSPDLHGSRTPTEKYKRAIYAQPGPGDDNYTRVAIDYQGALAGKGLELFYVEESFYDLYLLHVQGGGRINVFDAQGNKEVKYLSYAGKNKQPFQMVYHYMMKQGYIQPGNAGIPAQRKYLEENPNKEEEVFGVCPSYVYFKESDEEPVGLNNIPLTEKRSVAIDSRIYKTMGLITFVKAVKPTHADEDGTVVKAPFSRFFIAQDTGGAIRGAARCDLYAGYGPLAELAAYSTNDMGEQYFLIKK